MESFAESQAGWWSRLISPRVRHDDPGKQMNARVVGAVSLSLVCIFSLAQVLLEISDENFETSLGHMIGYAIMLGSFFANRYGRYQFAAMALVVMFGLVPIIRVVTEATNSPVSTLGFTTLSLVLGGVLLSARAILAIAIAEIGAVALTPRFNDAVAGDRSGYLDVLLVLVVGTVVSVFGVRHRARVERSRRAAIEESERRYRLLSEDLEERVKERTLELANTNRELESFAESVSHDLRSPLMGVDGYAAILAEDYGNVLDGDAMEKLSSIRGAAKRMSRLIDDLLKLSRMARLPLARTPQDMSGRCGAIAEDLRRSDPNRNVVFDIQPGIVVQADETLIGVVLDNLLRNAWKFSRNREDARISVTKSIEGGMIVFRVSDNGAGFDMAYAEKLFEPFQRLHRQSEFEGHGVGLASVERIVKRHGGWIRGEGKPDEGATFSFSLGSNS
ncbi:MAG: ATP-binding protein [Deltaproteobacteria bacterium]|nr:ATP-binding protein [Deltaproteobacteria bacterium]